MAKRGNPAFDTLNADAENSHAKLLAAAQYLNDAELAVKFRTTTRTVMTWKKRPLGYQPGQPGNPLKKASASPEAA